MTKEFLTLIKPPTCKIISDVSPFHNSIIYNLVRIPKAIREEATLGKSGICIQHMCNEVKDIFPMSRCLYAQEEDLWQAKLSYSLHIVWFACKVNFLPYNHVEVALGTSKLPRELMYIELGVWLSEFFNTEDSENSIQFKNGLFLFNVV